MRKEKTPDVTQGLAKLSASKKHGIKLTDSRGKCNSLSIFKQGAILKVIPLSVPKNTAHGVRGEVAGWSSSSRRRMRMFMLTHLPPSDFKICGVTLTVPGPLLDTERAKKLFLTFCREVDRRGWCAVWRLEIQERGMLHWHLMAGVPDVDGEEEKIRVLWHDLVRGMGSEVFTPPHVIGADSKLINKYGRVLPPPRLYLLPVTSCNSRMALPGAVMNSCNIQSEGESGGWLRYLQDHTTKAKQEQIALNVGRHWGVVGRKRFIPVLPDDVFEMTDSEYHRYVRFHQRLANPTQKSSCVFGRCLCGRRNFGKRGETVRFGSVETFRKMALLALGRYQPASSFLEYCQGKKQVVVPKIINKTIKNDPFQCQGKKGVIDVFSWFLRDSVIKEIKKSFDKFGEVRFFAKVAYFGNMVTAECQDTDYDRFFSLIGIPVQVSGEGREGRLMLCDVSPGR